MRSRIFFRLGITYGLFYVAYSSFFPFQTIYLTEIGYDQSAIALLSSCTAIGNFLFQFPVGRLFCGKQSTGKLLALFMVASVATGFLLSLFHSNLLWVILAILPVTLLDFSLIGQLDAFTLSLQSQYSSIRYSLVRAVGSLTGALATLTLGELYAGLGSSFMFGVHGFFMALGALSMLLLPRDEEPRVVRTYAKISSIRPFILLFLGGGLIFLAWRAILVYLPLLLVARGGTAAHQGLSMFFMSFSSFPALMLYPVLRKKCSCRLLLLIGGGSMALRLGSMALVTSPTTLAWLQMLESVSYGLLQPTVMELISLAVPEVVRPRVIALWTGIQMALCTVIANLLVQLLSNWMSLSSCFFALSLVAAVGLIPLTIFAGSHSKRRNSKKW